MKLVNLTCPNCSGSLEKVGDNLYCKSCGAAFAIDYDESDVEHEKLQTEDERAKRDFEHEKELLKIKLQQEEKARVAAEKREFRREVGTNIGKGIRARISALIALLVIVGIFYGCYRLMVKSGLMPPIKEQLASAMETTRSPYDFTADEISDEVLDNMIDAARNTKISTRSNGVRDLVDNQWVDYTLESVEYDSAYYIGNAEQGHNRVVILFKLTYTSSIGTKVTYDGSYFDNLKIDNDGNVISDYKPEYISRSSASWHRDSYEDREQCYRENVLAISGSAAEIKR